MVSILQKHDADPAAHIDQAMQALITETKKMVTMLAGDDLRDAGLIASLQKLEHYEIAPYGTAAALSRQLDFRGDKKLLPLRLQEEKTRDNQATPVATTSATPNHPTPRKTPS